MEEDQNIGTPSEQTGMLLFAGWGLCLLYFNCC